MRLVTRFAFGAVLMACAGPLAAADFSDPSWPCIQRKVDRLSIGLMWPAPVAEAELPPGLAHAVDELAQTLALRRVDLDTARAEANAFAQDTGADTDLMGQVFADVFAALSTRRGRIIAGIGEFSLSQIELSRRIDTARTEMDDALAADAPDFDRVDVLEEQIDWDQRIFTDRQKTIRYLCETPTLLEKRLYAIARILQEAGQGDG